jgi:hypothetical protein
MRLKFWMSAPQAIDEIGRAELFFVRFLSCK